MNSTVLKLKISDLNCQSFLKTKFQEPFFLNHPVSCFSHRILIRINETRTNKYLKDSKKCLIWKYNFEFSYITYNETS